MAFPCHLTPRGAPLPHLISAALPSQSLCQPPELCGISALGNSFIFCKVHFWAASPDTINLKVKEGSGKGWVSGHVKHCHDSVCSAYVFPCEITHQGGS